MYRINIINAYDKKNYLFYYALSYFIIDYTTQISLSENYERMVLTGKKTTAFFEEGG